MEKLAAIPLPILQRAKQLTALDKEVRPYLPKEIREYCEILNLREYELVIGVNNSTFYSRIYYDIPNILKEIQKKYPSIRSIKLKISSTLIDRMKPIISPTPPCENGKVMVKPSLSEKGILEMEAAISNITDPGLRATLNRIKDRLKK